MLPSPMEQTQLIQIGIILSLFFVWMIWIGWKSQKAHDKSESTENFLIGNRNANAALIAIGITMGWVDVFQFAFTPALTFDNGIWGLAYPLAASFGFLILYFFAGKIRDRAANTNAYMMGNYFATHYSPRCGALVGVTMTTLIFTWLMGQFIIGGQLLSTLTNIPSAYIVTVMGVVTLIYMLLGGFLGGLRTDLIQFFIFIAFASIMSVSIAPTSDEWINAVPKMPMGNIALTSLTIITFINTMMAPDVWQRIYSAKSASEAKRSMIYTFIIMTPMLLFFGFLGLVVSHTNAAPDSSNIATSIFQNIIPPHILSFAVIAFVAAIMSTISTTLFGTAMNVTSDILYELKLIAKESIPKTVRYVMIVILIATAFLSQMSFNFMSIATICLSSVLPVFPLAVVMIFDIKVSEFAAFYSLLLSLIAYFIGAYFNIYVGPFALAPLVIGVISIFGLEALYKYRTKK